MSEIDLTAAVPNRPGTRLRDFEAIEAAVRAAAPIIERAVREAAVEKLRAERKGTDGGFYDGVSVAISILTEAR